ncbi:MULTISPECIES: nucleotide exchange factor GrpE [Gordonia]|uniref:Protein GrpE n=1 Tax=Gordonia amicalis TaxID=89053 RepID=A0AAE4R0Z2_9ACTN|nr:MULTISPECIES: nucleotide exchange factor GrpE [Gordonia]ATD72380.1 nucleotide exchange factor GrpE [Gordonia sp. 1D]MCZ4578536.1 nucleotide exchange factor GrpE [Gordonia amicalis]MCZ4651662.1 nucleotide exchange factor GrpE [Gordonia amicalis]MDJ0455120.1 nucleotide exchange factor GrpE [Gordonia amicalis]MDV6310216.1 nucleotide exchange factor GrpE [Gordonia amicalis]
MTAGSHSTNGSGEEPVTVTDRRRIDPETGEVRDEPAAGPGPADAEPVVDEPDNEQPADATSPDARVAELTADLQRERAQFANFRRRAAEEKQGSVAYGKQILIDKLLPILDDLDRAREHGDLESGPLRAVADKLAGVLNTEGLEAFGASGDEFNPELHEAVQHDGTGDHPVIGAVYRCGYRLGEKVIRTAMVTVTDPEPAGDQAGAQ